MRYYQPKLPLWMIHEAVDVFLDNISSARSDDLSAYSKAWRKANNQLVLKGMEHLGHIAMPTYTSTPHKVDCNIAPDDPLYEIIINDGYLIEKYCEIYMFFLNQLKKGEHEYWQKSYPAFYIDAFKTLLAGHYLAYNIYYNKLSNRKPYNKFIKIIREIDKHEVFLKDMEAYLVNSNKPGSAYNNPAFALAIKYFIDEILTVNEIKRNHPNGQIQTSINFNVVFNSLVNAEKHQKKKKNNVLKLFINNLYKYVDKYQHAYSFRRTFNSICQIGLDNYNPLKNCIKPHQKIPINNADANINKNNSPSNVRRPN